jgi:hypothetical protein
VSLLNSLEEYATDVAKMNETGLSRVSALVRKQLTLEKRVEDLEEELKAAKENLRTVAEQDLPMALHEMGMKEVKMDDGSIVSVANFYNVSIPKDKTEEAFDWLRLNGHGDLVKNVVSATFGRAEDNRAKDLIGKLSDEGYAVAQKQWVEPMTLKAFAKEQVEQGTNIPTELFGLYIGEKAKVRRK